MPTARDLRRGFILAGCVSKRLLGHAGRRPFSSKYALASKTDHEQAEKKGQSYFTSEQAQRIQREVQRRMDIEETLRAARLSR